MFEFIAGMTVMYFIFRFKQSLVVWLKKTEVKIKTALEK